MDYVVFKFFWCDQTMPETDNRQIKTAVN